MGDKRNENRPSTTANSGKEAPTASSVRDPRGVDKFKLLANTDMEEASYDVIAERHLEKPVGVAATIASVAKSALGAGILSGHVAYMHAGWLVALITHIALGLLMMYSLYRLTVVVNIMYRRARIPSMSYSDAGECAMILTGNPKLIKLAKVLRVLIDFTVCCDLVGACICYQIIVAKTLKQLVEDKQITYMEPARAGLPSLRIWILILLVPFVLIVLLRHLAWLASLALGANLIVALSVIVTFYYAIQSNPKFEGLNAATDFNGFFQFCGVTVFAMSCCGVVIALENNMKNPKKFPKAFITGFSLIMLCTITSSLFGYIAYKDKCDAPITINFPMELLPKILKACMCIMVYITFGLNFWVPFNIIFYYIIPLLNPNKLIMWEYVVRVIMCVILNLIACVFPDIAVLISLVGSFAIVYIAFVWPMLLELLVCWKRPGLGAGKWRLWKCLVIIGIAQIIFVAGTYVNFLNVIEFARKSKEFSPFLDLLFYDSNLDDYLR